MTLGLTVASRGEEVEVASLRFTSARAPHNTPDAWFEAEVVLNVAPPPSAPGRMVNRVRVALAIGWELPAPAGGVRRVEYYRAEAECVALEAGRADVRFYLPPELVKRDQLHGSPKFWTVDLAAGGRALPATRTASAAPLAADPAARRAFQIAATAAAPANDGLLQPQYLTPFALEYPRATPNFVRREAAAFHPARASP
ncbi:MAG: hypothetical protein H7343_14930 [Undibacterium sp.]|nr:hypothetical protein [Opitutaceae bacterium]